MEAVSGDLTIVMKLCLVNFTTYVTFLEVNVGDGEDSPFKDLSQYYTCKRGEEIVSSMQFSLSPCPCVSLVISV